MEHGWPIGFVYAASAAVWAYVLVNAVTPDWLIPWKGIVFGPVWPWVATVVIVLTWLGLRRWERDASTQLKETVKKLEDSFGKSTVTVEGLLDLLKEEPSIVRLFRDRKGALDTMKRRLEHQKSALDHARGIADKATKGHALSVVLSNVIDLPSRWIHDVWTGRR